MSSGGRMGEDNKEINIKYMDENVIMWNLLFYILKKYFNELKINK